MGDCGLARRAYFLRCLSTDFSGLPAPNAAKAILTKALMTAQERRIARELFIIYLIYGTGCGNTWFHNGDGNGMERDRLIALAPQYYTIAICASAK
jgi:hypothetical protein